LRTENWIPLKDVVAPDAATRVWTRQPERVPMWYAESWALVHFLAFSSNGARASQLNAYLSAVRAGKPWDAAFTGAFGAPASEVEGELRAYLRAPLRAVRVALDSPVTADGAGLTVRRLSVADAQAVQGCLLADNGALEAAEKYLSAGLADDPRHVETQACLGQVRVQQRRVPEALAILEPLVAAAPDSADLHYRLGRALMDGARMDDAIAAFSRATVLKPDFVDGWFGLSLATLAQHRDVQANAAFRQVLGLDSNVEWMRRRAAEALALDRADVAATDARAYVARHGLADDMGVYVAFMGAIAYRRIGKAEEASALLDEAVPAVDPKGWTARVLAFMRGKMEAKAFLDAAGNNGERTEAHAYLGFADLQAGRQEEGRSHLEWVRERGSRNYTEYDLALGELARLERAKR
jgi:tetratricopeptide (TPR) repeat protein